jgi:hypothetical protein
MEKRNLLKPKDFSSENRSNLIYVKKYKAFTNKQYTKEPKKFADQEQSLRSQSDLHSELANPTGKTTLPHLISIFENLVILPGKSSLESDVFHLKYEPRLMNFFNSSRNCEELLDIVIFPLRRKISFQWKSTYGERFNNSHFGLNSIPEEDQIKLICNKSTGEINQTDVLVSLYRASKVMETLLFPDNISYISSNNPTFFYFACM